MRTYLFLLAAVLTAGLSAQTVYVDIDNATPGDGTSWATAYNNLNDALLGADAGAEVWIAAGTYVTPDTASFFIDKELTVRGGFAGTETSADDADPAANLTILSGDVMGNDPDLTYDSTRFDDNNRVLFITDTNDVSAYTVTLDGLIIEHGGIAADNDDSFNDLSGGGLRSYARVNVTRTTFRNNFARNGGAIFIRFGSSSGSVFDSLTVSNNFVGNNRAIYVRDNDGVTFMNSEFEGQGSDNLMQSGIFRAFRTTNFTVMNSSFRNIFTNFAGGMAFITDSDDARIINCNAADLKADNSCAGVIVTSNNNYTPDRERDLNDFVMDGCTLDGLMAEGWGASVYFDNVNGTVKNTTITDAVTVRNGAAFYAQYDSDNPKQTYDILLDNNVIDNADGGSFGGSTAILYFDTTIVNVVVKDTEIKDGVANDGRGGALYYQGTGGDVTLLNSVIDGNFGESGAFVVNADQCDFTIRNTSFTDNGDPNLARRGGAISAFITDGGSITIDSSEFIGNITTELGGLFSAGGALYIFGNDSVAMPVTITNSLFNGNATSGSASGGAIYLSRGIDLTVDNTDFIANNGGGIGGALHGRTFEIGGTRDTLEDGSVSLQYQPHGGVIRNSRFLSNSSSSQGGAIGTFRAAYDVENSVFFDNRLIGAESLSGGAIIFNGLSSGQLDNGDIFLTGDLELVSTMANNTFVDNFRGEDDGAVGSSIALFQQGVTEDNGDTVSITLNLINNAFLNTIGEPSIQLEAGSDDPGFDAFGDIIVKSFGGNFFNTENGPLIDLGENTNDFIDESIEGFDDVYGLFVDLEDNDGEGVNANLVIPEDLTDNPLINNGVVSDLVPNTDIDGNPRGDAPDIGAYEADQEAVSTGEPLANSGLDISFFPNPTKDVLNVRNDEAGIERFALIVSDQNGRVLKARQLAGASNRVDFSNLPAGVYNLQVVVNGRIYGQQVVKQ